MTAPAIYVKTAAKLPVILGKYPESVIKYIAYDNFRKKTVIAKGTLLDGGNVINSAYHLYLSEDEVLAFQRYLRDVKSFKDVYEVLSETKRGSGLARLVVKTNQWGGIVLYRITSVPRVEDSVSSVVARDDDVPDPVPITDELFDMDVEKQIEWKDGYEQFNVSNKDDTQNISKSILMYYRAAYGDVEEPKPKRGDKRKTEKAKAPPKKKKKVITVDEDEDDGDNDDDVELPVGPIVPLSILFTLMHDTGKSIVECITEHGDLLASSCERVERPFDYIDFYKKHDEKSIMDFYEKVKHAI